MNVRLMNLIIGFALLLPCTQSIAASETVGSTLFPAGADAFPTQVQCLTGVACGNEDVIFFDFSNSLFVSQLDTLKFNNLGVGSALDLHEIDIVRLDYPVPIVNAPGPDIWLAQSELTGELGLGAQDINPFGLSFDAGVTWYTVPEAAFTPDPFLTGQSTTYTDGGALEALGMNVWTASIDLSDFGVADGVSLTSVDIRGNQSGGLAEHLDVFGVGNLTAQTPTPDSNYREWQPGPPLPATRADGAAIVGDHHGDIYFFGGESIGGIVDSVYRYVAISDSWIELAAMPLAVRDSAAVLSKGFIFVIGGMSNSGPESVVQVYDLATGQWSFDPDLPEALYSHSAVVGSKEQIVVMGGYNSNGEATSTVYLGQYLIPPEMPVITSSPVVAASLDEFYTYNVTATGYPDPTYSLFLAPNGMGIDSITGSISWQPLDGQVGEHEVIVRASNSVGDVDQTYIVTVTSATPPPPPINVSPTANAGPDQAIALPLTVVTLDGSATDDGLPNPPGQITYSWSVVSAPSPVTFGNADAAVTTADFSSDGIYTLRLSVSDGELSRRDDMTIMVYVPPVANAGLDQVLTLPDTVTLDGSATDDGFPANSGALTFNWSVVSGPGAVAFENASDANTVASFSVDGGYTLQFSVSNGLLSDTDHVNVTVNPEPVPTDTPPPFDQNALKVELKGIIQELGPSYIVVAGVKVWYTVATVVKFAKGDILINGQKVEVTASGNVDDSVTAGQIQVDN